jgi:putative phosphoesterase
MDNDFVPPTAPLDPQVIPGSFQRIAVLSDVHGNLPAFEAALADVSKFDVQAVLFLGDFTWGPQPLEVISRARSISVPTWFVRGNAERAVIEFAAGTRETENARDDWMVAAHGEQGLAEILTFAPALQITVDGLGGLRLAHGSPRSDVELLTPGSSPERVEAALVGVDDPVVGHGHTHIQYQRRLGERTVFGPGSVGIPYDTKGKTGARWALVTDAIELRVAPFDIEDSIDVARAVGYAGLANYEKYLRTPITVEELDHDAETLGFSD